MYNDKILFSKCLEAKFPLNGLLSNLLNSQADFVARPSNRQTLSRKMSSGFLSALSRDLCGRVSPVLYPAAPPTGRSV